VNLRAALPLAHIVDPSERVAAGRRRAKPEGSRMTEYLEAVGMMAATVAVCNVVVLLFRHPRLPRWIGSEIVVMMVGVMLAMAFFFTYALAVLRIAVVSPGSSVTWPMGLTAGLYFIVAAIVSVVMGMRQRLARVREGGTPLPQSAPSSPSAAPAGS
jgi:hypothetical protein